MELKEIMLYVALILSFFGFIGFLSGGDGGTIINIFNGSSSNTTSTTYYPYQVATISGTNSGGNNVGNISYDDGKYYNVTEAAGANPLTIQLNYTNVTNFNSVIMAEKYTGSSSHNILVEIYDYLTSSWEQYQDITGQEGFVYSNIPVPDPQNHINNTNVMLRFRHVENGVPSHLINIDFVQLIQGTSTLSNNQHDSLSGRTSLTNHPQYLDIYGNRSVQGNFNILGNGTAQNLFVENNTIYFAPVFIPGSSGTGGNITNDGSYVVHSFYSNGTFTAPLGVTSFEYLVIAGGASGGGDSAAGGGAGGMLNGTTSSISGAINITVGQGGASKCTSGAGNNGENSSIGTLILARGGGGGGGYPNVLPLSGGSGGGGGVNAGTTVLGANGTLGQGFNGGFGNYTGGLNFGDGGGGGAGGQGGNGTTAGVGGFGGPGRNSSITGTSLCYAGGGAGSGGASYGTASCGGGTGAFPNGNATFYGAGGAGATFGGGKCSGKGYQGIVIIKYLPTGTYIRPKIYADANGVIYAQNATGTPVKLT